MNKFKIGDKVRLLVDQAEEGLESGALGVVQEDDDMPFVDWETSERYVTPETEMCLVDPGKSRTSRRYFPTNHHHLFHMFGRKQFHQLLIHLENMISKHFAT